MDPITAAALSQTVKGVTGAVSALTKDVTKEAAEGFDAVMRSMLSPDEANSVNEEELFAALIGQRLEAHAGPEASSAFQKALEEKKAANTRADGYVNVEQAANEALASLVTAGTVSDSVAATVKKESFAAAQLDDNKTALFDGRGGANDPTIAVMNMEAALIQAQQIIEKIESGETDLEDVPAAGEEGDATGSVGASGGDVITPTGNEVDGAGGFVFKPESDHGKQLVVLLPAQMAGDVVDVLLKDENGQEIERGVSSGFANPDTVGDREHFRFTKAGAAYPQNISVEVTLADGSVKEYQIPDPSQRWD